MGDVDTAPVRGNGPSRSDKPTPRPDAAQITLALLHQQLDAYAKIIADLYGRLYCVELAIGVRVAGSLDEPIALRWSGGASRHTHEFVRDRVYAQLTGATE